MAYGGSQARGQIRAVAAGLYHGHNNADPSHVCYLHHSSWQCRILNPLSKTRDPICILMDASQIHWPLSHDGNSNFLIFLFYCLFRAALVAYGGSQARGRIRAVTAATSMRDPSRFCKLHHSSWQCQILNPLSEARHQTWVLKDASWTCFCWAKTVTPTLTFLID